MTEEVTKSVRDLMEGFETFKKELAPKVEKLDGFDEAKFKKISDAWADQIEAEQKRDARLKALEDANKAAADQIKQLEAAAQRPGAPELSDEKKEKKVAEERKELFTKFLRKGTGSGAGQEDFSDFIARANVGEDEIKSMAVKTMSVNSEPNGGYLVMPEFGGMIQTLVYETSPIRQLANVVTIGTDAYELLTDGDEADAGWVGEEGTRSGTDTPTLGKQIIPTHELYAQPKATQKLLDDAYLDVESWLRDKVADKFARKEATAFVSGTGVTSPRGILAYTAGTTPGSQQIEQVNSGANGNFTYDGLVSLQNSLKEVYQNNASFLVKRAGFGLLMKLKDGNSMPIFNPNYDKNTGISTGILGRPLRFADDLEAAATNSLSMVYGDFRRGYVIVDRIGIRILRDPFTSKPYVKFYTTKRVGGAVSNFEALKIQKLAA